MKKILSLFMAMIFMFFSPVFTSNVSAKKIFPNDTVVSQEEISKPTTTNRVSQIMHNLYKFVISWGGHYMLFWLASNLIFGVFDLPFDSYTSDLNCAISSLPLALLCMHFGLI